MPSILYENQSLKASILQVFDGDTLLLRYHSEVFVSRCRWIDTPELPRPEQDLDNAPIDYQRQWHWGQVATDWLTAQLKNRPYIRVVLKGRDQWGRWLADWYWNRVGFANSIQIALCANGLAANSLPYQQYDFRAKRDLALFKGILGTCARAKERGVGFWADPDFTLPYQYKRAIREDGL